MRIMACQANSMTRNTPKNVFYEIEMQYILYTSNGSKLSILKKQVKWVWVVSGLTFQFFPFHVEFHNNRFIKCSF